MLKAAIAAASAAVARRTRISFMGAESSGSLRHGRFGANLPSA
jgi:hypothetical protein